MRQTDDFVFKIFPLDGLEGESKVGCLPPVRFLAPDFNAPVATSPMPASNRFVEAEDDPSTILPDLRFPGFL